MLRKLKSEINQTEVNANPWCTAVFGVDYLRGTLIALTLSELVQLSGYNLFNMFSVRIFTKLNETASPDQ